MKQAITEAEARDIITQARASDSTAHMITLRIGWLMLDSPNLKRHEASDSVFNLIHELIRQEHDAKQ